MNRPMIFGIAIVLCAMSMSVSAGYTPPGAPPCTSANIGEGYTKYLSGGYSKEWQCQSLGWELIYLCTPDGCYVP